MKTSHRILRSVLSIVMLAALVIGMLPVMEASAAREVKRYTVLVLDTMGEHHITSNGVKLTVSASLDKVKEASQSFVSTMLEAEGDNQIAVINCAHTSTIASGFSTDEAQLQSIIGGLTDGSGYSDVHHAFELADELLSQAPEGAICNIVLFSGCIPSAGPYDYEGHYTEDDLNYYVTKTGVYQYAHANCVYDKAMELADKGYKIYTLGCVTNLEENPDSYNFFMKVMQEISNAGYYDAAEPEDLIFVFEEIASDIINPLYIYLSAEKIEQLVPVQEDDKTTRYYSRYVYEITAEIENRDVEIARNVVCNFVCPDGAVPFDQMLYCDQDVQVNVGDIGPGEIARVTWYLEVPHPDSQFNAYYEVHAKAENTLSIKSVGNVYVNVFASEEVNELIHGIDGWSFSNSPKHFTDGSDEPYYISDEDLDALSYLDPQLRSVLEQYAANTWGGSCYGMATVAILTKMGVIHPSEIQSGKETLYTIKKTNNDEVESFINFYHLQQYFTAHQDDRVAFRTRSNAERLETLWEYATATSSGGAPTLLEFYFYPLDNNGNRKVDKDGDPIVSGHAVVAYKAEEGSWKWDGVTYNRKIAIYDPNYPDGSRDDKEHLYFIAGTDTWTIPAYCVSADAWIGLALNDVPSLDIVNHYTATANAEYYLTALNNTQLLANNGNGEINLNGGEADGNVVPLVNVGTLSDGESNSPITYVFPYSNSDYCTIAPADRDSASGFIMTTPNGTIVSDTTNVDTITYTDVGGVSISGEEAVYEISVIFEDPGYMGWTQLTVAGENVSELELSYQDDGIMITGDNLMNVRITGTDGYSEYSTIATTFTGSMYLVSGGSGKVDVFTDDDDDGDFDTRINDTESYVVTFDANGGSVDKEFAYTDHEGKIGKLPEPQRDGYEFLGWYSKAENGKEITKKTEFDKHTTIYAQWKATSIVAILTQNPAVLAGTAGVVAVILLVLLIPKKKKKGGKAAALSTSAPKTDKPSLQGLDRVEALLTDGSMTEDARNYLRRSLYCPFGNDPTPVVALGPKVALYVYADEGGYGAADFETQSQELFQKIKDRNFILTHSRPLTPSGRLSGAENAVLTLWRNASGKSFYLVYVRCDADALYENVYTAGDETVEPLCFYNHLYDTGSTLLEDLVGRTEYILGHCYGDQYRKVGEFEYLGEDESEGAKAGLYRRG